MRFLGGHLGSAVSALVDGQLPPEVTERCWDHVLRCPGCRADVEREIWVKNRLALLAGNEPPPRLLEMLHELASSAPAGPHDAGPLLDSAGRTRRLTGLALLGAGSVSVAVFGVAALAGPLDVGGLPAWITGTSQSGTPTGTTSGQPPATTTSSEPSVHAGPRARVQGRLPGWRAVSPSSAVPTAGGSTLP